MAVQGFIILVSKTFIFSEEAKITNFFIEKSLQTIRVDKERIYRHTKIENNNGNKVSVEWKRQKLFKWSHEIFMISNTNKSPVLKKESFRDDSELGKLRKKSMFDQIIMTSNNINYFPFWFISLLLIFISSRREKKKKQA